MTLKELRRLFNRYRKHYYADRPIPPAKDVIFRYVKEGEKSAVDRPLIFRKDHLLALTSRLMKEGKTIWVIEFHESLKTQPRLHAVMLMHEMSHVYNWRLDHGPGWDIEALRLGSLGAMREFF